MANKPTRAYPSIVGFHDAVTWLCQIVMFLVLGLLVTPSRLWDYAPQGIFVALVLTLVARPLAVWLCLGPFGFTAREKAFVSWVGLRGAVSIFLAAIPTLAGVPNAPAYFNIAFFVVLVSLLVQGSTLTAAARRLGVALKGTTQAVSRVEIDIPGQTEQEIVGYPVTADSVILGLSRLPAWARVRDGGAQGPHPRRADRRRPAAGRLLLLPGVAAAAAAARQPVPRQPGRGAAARPALRRAAAARRDAGRRRSSSSTSSTSGRTRPRRRWRTG